jgi:hypothetical protein
MLTKIFQCHEQIYEQKILGLFSAKNLEAFWNKRFGATLKTVAGLLCERNKNFQKKSVGLFS